MNHFMYKEILEQPTTLSTTLDLVKRRLPSLIDQIRQRDVQRIFLTGCGTSYYAALMGEFYLERIAEIQSRAFPSSEFTYCFPRRNASRCLLIVASRSGETTEAVQALKEAKKRGAVTLAISNNPASSLVEEADHAFQLGVGEENSIVMTKTFSSLVFTLQLLSLEFSGNQRNEEIAKVREQLHKIPRLASSLVGKFRDEAEGFAKKYSGLSRFIYLGSGPNYPICLEAGLKLRETSYVPVEVFHTLEFRHGPMAGADENVLVIAVLTRSETTDKQLKVLKEIRERNAPVLAISNVPAVRNQVDGVVDVPNELDELSLPLLNLMPLQLFAYFYSATKGLNPDSPRSLVRFVKLD